MRDKDKTKEQLISELVEMRQRIGELETSETQGKRAEEALQRKEAYFRSLIENASDAIVIIDGDGTIRYQSPSYERVLGYRPEEEIGRDMFDNIHPDDATNVADGLARLLEHPGGILGVEVRARHRDGSWHTLEATANNLLHDPAVEGIVVNFRDITDRKRAEEALRESEARYSALVEQAMDGVIIVQDGAFRFANRAHAEITGYTVEEMEGMPFLDTVVPELRDVVIQRFRSRMAGEQLSPIYETKVQCKDGTEKEVEARSRTIQYQGRPADLSIVRDITERKQAEEELRDSEQKYRHLFENLNDAALLADVETGRIVETNKQAEVLLGRTREEIIGMHQRELHPAEKAEEYRHRFATHIEKGHAADYDGEVITKDGSIVPVTISAAPLTIGGKRLILGLFRDITDRKRAEEALRESEAHYRLLAENITDVISVTDMNGQPTYMSPSVTRLLGFSVDEAMAHSMEEDGLTPASHEVAREKLARQLAVQDNRQTDHSKPGMVELEFYRKDGSTVWVEVAVSFLRDSDGRPVEILTVLRDVSERKRLDEERERLLRELAEKTRELEQIVFVASHDLRSPLVNIQGFTRELEQSLEEVRSVLESEDIPSAVKDKLAVPVNQAIPDAFRYILASSAKIDSLLSGLLRLSRLGRAALIMEKLDMNELMADVTRAFEFLIKEAGAALEVEDLPPCHGDKTQVNQVLSNLVDNALKFLQPSRAGIIRVSGRSEDGRAIYCVEDNGIGIAPEHQERVFEIFQRLDPSANSGEGLGLAIVRRILERHAGKAWVESEPGKGSKFFVSLPSV